METRFRDSITLRFILIVGTLVVISQLLIGIYQITRTINREGRAAYAKALGQANFLISVTPDDILANNFYPLENLMRQTVADPDIVYSVIVNNAGEPLTNYLDPNDPYIIDAKANSVSLNTLDLVTRIQIDPDIVHIRRPIVAENLLVGELYLGYTTAEIRAETRFLITQALAESLLTGVIITGVMITLFQLQIGAP